MVIDLNQHVKKRQSKHELQCYIQHGQFESPEFPEKPLSEMTDDDENLLHCITYPCFTGNVTILSKLCFCERHCIKYYFLCGTKHA